VAADRSQHLREIRTRQARQIRSRGILQSVEAVLHIPALAVRAHCLVGQRLESARHACGDDTNIVEVSRVTHERRRGNGARAARGVGVQRTRRALAGGSQMLKLPRHTQDTRRAAVAMFSTAWQARGARTARAREAWHAEAVGCARGKHVGRAVARTQLQALVAGTEKARLARPANVILRRVVARDAHTIRDVVGAGQRARVHGAYELRLEEAIGAVLAQAALLRVCSTKHQDQTEQP